MCLLSGWVSGCIRGLDRFWSVIYCYVKRRRRNSEARISCGSGGVEMGLKGAKRSVTDEVVGLEMCDVGQARRLC